MPATARLPTDDEVRGALRGVIDPELGSDIIELGMVRSASIGDDGTWGPEEADVLLPGDDTWYDPAG